MSAVAAPDPVAQRPPVARIEWLALGLVLALALALRLVNFGWGIPLDPYTGTYHPDERKIAEGALAFPGDILTRTDLRYPTAYHYAIGLAGWPLRPLLRPLLPTPPDELLATFVLGRMLSVLLALGAIVLTWVLGRRWYGSWAGLTAAALLAVTLVHVVHSGYATLDVPTSCLVVASLWACDKVIRKPGWGKVVLLGALSGLLIGTKYPGGVIVLPGLLALALGRQREQADGGWRSALLSPGFVGSVGLYLGLTAAVALATTPTILLHPSYLRAAFDYERDRQGFGGTSWLDLDAWRGAFDALAVAAGPVLGLLFALGLAAAFVRPGYPEALLLALVLPYYLVLGDRVANRYLILLLPAFALLAGRLVHLVGSSSRPAVRWAGIGVALLAVLAGLSASASAVASIHQPDVRTEAARFLAENAPAGATVCLDQVNDDTAQTWKEPPVSRERYRVVDCAEGPEWVLTIGGSGRMERALASPFLRPDYSWDPAQLDWWPDGEPTPPERLRFYDALFPGRDAHADYVLAADYTRERLPTVPFDVSAVRVWRRQ
jgi:4-amino-4-deoxy-L-arabinose transferase-like glycosyltransferase